MNVKKTVAKAITGISKNMAGKACGASSFWGIYQPKEPSKLQTASKQVKK